MKLGGVSTIENVTTLPHAGVWVVTKGLTWGCVVIPGSMKIVVGAVWKANYRTSQTTVTVKDLVIHATVGTSLRQTVN